MEVYYDLENNIKRKMIDAMIRKNKKLAELLAQQEGQMPIGEISEGNDKLENYNDNGMTFNPNTYNSVDGFLSKYDELTKNISQVLYLFRRTIGTDDAGNKVIQIILTDNQNFNTLIKLNATIDNLFFNLENEIEFYKETPEISFSKPVLAKFKNYMANFDLTFQDIDSLFQLKDGSNTKVSINLKNPKYNIAKASVGNKKTISVKANQNLSSNITIPHNPNSPEEVQKALVIGWEINAIVYNILTRCTMLQNDIMDVITEQKADFHYTMNDATIKPLKQDFINPVESYIMPDKKKKKGKAPQPPPLPPVQQPVVQQPVVQQPPKKKYISIEDQFLIKPPSGLGSQGKIEYAALIQIQDALYAEDTSIEKLELSKQALDPSVKTDVKQIKQINTSINDAKDQITDLEKDWAAQYKVLDSYIVGPKAGQGYKKNKNYKHHTLYYSGGTIYSLPAIYK